MSNDLVPPPPPRPRGTRANVAIPPKPAARPVRHTEAETPPAAAKPLPNPFDELAAHPNNSRVGISEASAEAPRELERFNLAMLCPAADELFVSEFWASPDPLRQEYQFNRILTESADG